MDNPNPDNIRIETVDNGNLWRLWIPPSNPNHRYEDGDDKGVFGNTYFTSLGDLISFLALSAYGEMIRTGWEPKYLKRDDE